MRLEGDSGTFLELHLMGYQFAAITPEPGGFDWDANWLLVDGRASDGERSWHFLDPCLLTVECEELAAWLEAVAGAWSDLAATDFIEPNLEFRRTSGPSDPPVVRVTFRLEARPSWAPDLSKEEWDSTWLDFSMSPDVLRAAASDLRADAARYPKR